MAPPTEPRPAGPTLLQGWPVVLASFFGIFTAYTLAFMLGPMLDEMGRDLGKSLAVMGQLVALIFIPWGVSAPLIGTVSDRYGRKPVLLAGLVGMSLSSLASALAPDFLTLALCRLAMGACGGCVPPSCVAAVGDHFTGRRRGNAMAIAASGVAASVILGIPALAYATERLGWRGAFALAGAFGLAATLFAAAVFPRARRSEPPASFLGSFAWMRHTPPWFLLAANVLERIIFSAFLTYVSVFLIRSYGISLGSLAGFFTTMSVGTLIGGLLGGPLAGLRPRFYVIAGVVLLQVGLLIFQFTLAPPLALSIGAGFALSLAGNVSRAAVMDTLVTLAPRSRGAIIGSYATSNQLGQMLGAALGGAAIAWGGFGAIGGLGLVAGGGSAVFYFLAMPRLARAQAEGPA